MTRPRPVLALWHLLLRPTGMVAHDLNLATAHTEQDLITVLLRLGLITSARS